MMICSALARNGMFISEFGSLVNVKDFYYARLKYYLSCVYSVIGNIPYEYRNYEEFEKENGKKINKKELETMYEILKICSPDQMENMLRFIKVEEGSKTLDGYLNNFFEITCHRDIFSFGLNQYAYLFLALTKYSSIKIMFYQNSWIIKNYYQPIKQLKDQIYNY
jgi:hypothetical protein